MDQSDALVLEIVGERCSNTLFQGSCCGSIGSGNGEWQVGEGGGEADGDLVGFAAILVVGIDVESSVDGWDVKVRHGSW